MIALSIVFADVRQPPERNQDPLTSNLCHRQATSAMAHRRPHAVDPPPSSVRAG